MFVLESVAAGASPEGAVGRGSAARLSTMQAVSDEETPVQ